MSKTGREPSKAASLLNEAAYESGAIRSVPPDCFFYLGRALQMSGKFQEAIQAYNRFAGQAGKKSSKEMNVPELIRQCNEQKGKIADTEFHEQEKAVRDSAFTIIPGKAIEEDTAGKTLVMKNRIDSLPPEYDKLLDQALESRIKADSISGIADHKTHKAIIGTDSVTIKMKAAVMVNTETAIVIKKDTSDSVVKKVVAGTPVLFRILRGGKTCLQTG